MLLNAYASGAFPMADPRNSRIQWFTADPRAVIDLDAFHVPKSLARLVRQGRFTITFDAAFEQVMRACAIDRSPDNQCWINEEMIRAYVELHRIGHAHSVEAWLPDAAGVRLVGGLYGVSIGAAFFGESMFTRRQGADSLEPSPSGGGQGEGFPAGRAGEAIGRTHSRRPSPRPPLPPPDSGEGTKKGALPGAHPGAGSGGANASKVCLVHLVERLRARGFTLLDTQYSNPHMDQFRPIEIPLKDYLVRLQRALAAGDCWR